MFLAFSDETMERFCKGLHYSLWMQDKPLLQEELSLKIANIINLPKLEEQSMGMIKALLNSLSKEWSKIDCWRMDKFLYVSLFKCSYLHGNIYFSLFESFFERFWLEFVVKIGRKRLSINM